MRKVESMRRYTAEELKAMRRRGEDRTDWAKVDAMTETDLERAIAEDEDERDLDPDWTRAELVIPQPRQSVHLRLEPEVVDFFKAGDKGHISRMQAVLRAYVDAQKRRQAFARLISTTAVAVACRRLVHVQTRSTAQVDQPRSSGSRIPGTCLNARPTPRLRFACLDARLDPAILCGVRHTSP